MASYKLSTVPCSKAAAYLKKKKKKDISVQDSRLLFITGYYCGFVDSLGMYFLTYLSTIFSIRIFEGLVFKF